MKTYVMIAFSVGTLALLAGANASAQVWGHPSFPSSGACFYEDANYGGRYFCAGSGENVSMVPSGSNDQISSIRVFGNVSVTVYKDARFKGSSKHFESNVSNLARVGFNDRVSSFRIEARGYGSSGWGGGYGGGWNGSSSDWSGGAGGIWGRPSFPRNGACFYEHANYGGGYFCASTGENVSRVPYGANDKISSIRLFGNSSVTVYKDSSFKGDSRHFETNVNNLTSSGFNDRLTSLRVESRGGNSWGGGYGGGGSWGHSGGSRWTYQQARDIVTRGYRSVLGREPDPSGLRTYTGQVMVNNWSQHDFDNVLRGSDEYRNKHR